jgi:hypothetical protein
VKIASDEIPQADRLSDVAEVVAAVAKGATTFQEIADAIGKVERQGRYYRKAAEIVGLIQSVGLNQSALTPLGQRWVAANAIEQEKLLIQATLSARIFQRVIPFIEAHPKGVTRDRLRAFLDEVADLGGTSMAPRRVATVIHWLNETGIVREERNRYVLGKLPAGLSYLDYSTNEAEPLLPVKYGLTDYTEHEKKFKERLGTMTVLVDEAKLERASHSHIDLVNLVSSRIKNAGLMPKMGKLIDLATTIGGQNQFIFEMKSTTAANARSQVRQGISQLYEYRYIEQAKDATLVLVLEANLVASNAWMRDYLVEDRNVLVVWDGDGNLYCPAKTAAKLSFLQPVAV